MALRTRCLWLRRIDMRSVCLSYTDLMIVLRWFNTLLNIENKKKSENSKFGKNFKKRVELQFLVAVRGVFQISNWPKFWNFLSPKLLFCFFFCLASNECKKWMKIMRNKFWKLWSKLKQLQQGMSSILKLLFFDFYSAGE